MAVSMPSVLDRTSVEAELIGQSLPLEQQVFAFYDAVRLCLGHGIGRC